MIEFESAVSMGCWSAVFGFESGISFVFHGFVGDLLILICFVSWSMYLTPGGEWTLVQLGLDETRGRYGWDLEQFDETRWRCD